MKCINKLLIFILLIVTIVVMCLAERIDDVYFTATQTVTGVWIVLAAFYGLFTWKKQLLATKQTTLIERFSIEIFTYVKNMDPVILYYEMIKDIFNSTVELYPTKNKYEVFIEYVEKSGARDAERLNEFLSVVDNTISKIKTLDLEAQSLGLSNYNECRQHISNLIWVHSHIKSYTKFLAGSWYWENPNIRETVEKYINKDANEICNIKKNSFDKIIEYLQKNYKAIIN